MLRAAGPGLIPQELSLRRRYSEDIYLRHGTGWAHHRTFQQVNITCAPNSESAHLSAGLTY